MVTAIISMWECERCGKRLDNKEDAIRHESTCRWIEPQKRYVYSETK